jgi:hypothetical protein
MYEDMMRLYKRILLWGLICLCALQGQAQTRKVQNRPYLDMRTFHYGFVFGMHTQDLEFTNNGFVDSSTGEQWYVEADSYNVGFNVGVLGEWKLTEHWALRVIPSLYFGQKHVMFHEQVTQRDTSQTLKSTYLAVPFEFKYTAQRFNNYRPYIMLGVMPMTDLTVKKQGNLLTKSFDCMAEAGVGCDFYLPFFKFIPELKFCYGLSNILNKNRSDLIDRSKLKFTNSVDKMKSSMIVLSFYFE